MFSSQEIIPHTHFTSSPSKMRYIAILIDFILWIYHYLVEESLSLVIVDPNENYDQTGTRNVGDVQFDRRKLIGQGAYGIVFAGTFKSKNVAVKRIQLVHSRPGRENDDLERSTKFHQLLNHPNIEQFKHFETDDDFG
jgi:serine/threonine protein kinase